MDFSDPGGVGRGACLICGLVQSETQVARDELGLELFARALLVGRLERHRSAQDIAMRVRNFICAVHAGASANVMESLIAKGHP